MIRAAAYHTYSHTDSNTLMWCLSEPWSVQPLNDMCGRESGDLYWWGNLLYLPVPYRFKRNCSGILSLGWSEKCARFKLWAFIIKKKNAKVKKDVIQVILGVQHKFCSSRFSDRKENRTDRAVASKFVHSLCAQKGSSESHIARLRQDAIIPKH